MSRRRLLFVTRIFPFLHSARLVLAAVALIIVPSAKAQQSLQAVQGEISPRPAAVGSDQGEEAQVGAARAPESGEAADLQATREAALARMLSGATLEGSFTSGPRGAAGAPELSTDKYTLGEVRKLAGNLWVFPTRIQYGDHDLTLPITIPIEWAADTPVVVINELAIPGLGTFSARVLFFDDHYAGYWKHGERGGNMFGTITRGAEAQGGGAVPQGGPGPPAETGAGARDGGGRGAER